MTSASVPSCPGGPFAAGIGPAVGRPGHAEFASCVDTLPAVLEVGLPEGSHTRLTPSAGGALAAQEPPDVKVLPVGGELKRVTHFSLVPVSVPSWEPPCSPVRGELGLCPFHRGGN